MSWTDEELDKLFSDSAGDMTFEYKKEYFKDIENYLPISKKRDILWTGMTLFMGSIVVYLMIQPVNSVWKNPVSAQHIAINNIEDSDSNLNQGQNTIKVGEVLSGEVGETNIRFETVNEKDNQSVYSGVVSNTVEKQTESNSNDFVALADSPAKSKTDNTLNVSDDHTDLSLLELELLKSEGLSKNLLKAAPQIDRIDVTPGVDFFVQGIAGVGQGKMLPGEKVSKITGLGVGVELNRRKLTASVSLNGVVSHHQGMELSRISKVYGFGATEYKSTIEYSKLFLAESELTLGYRFGRFTAFSGVNVNYLVTTESTVSSFENEKLNTLDVRKLYGYNTGLKNWGLKPMVGMSYDFKNRIQVGANIGAQVIQTVEPEFLEGTSRPLPLEGRLYLRLKL